MAPCLHSAVIATFVLLLVGQHSNAVLTEAEVFWRTALPDSPLPDRPILKLLHPETSIVNKPKDDDTVAEAFSLTWLMWGLRSPSGPTKHSNRADTSIVNTPKADNAVAEAFSLTWLMWGLRSPSRPTKNSSPSPSHERDHSADEYLAQGLFFHEDLVQAANMEETLYMCGLPPASAGEVKFCATSLEALVEGSMEALGTRNIRPVISDLPCSGAPKQPYTVRSVRQVDGSSFVSCHDHNYPYTVYMCHNTPSTRAYIVELEGACSGLDVTVAAICHADTSHWNPEHVSFKILGTKPGGAPVCHYLPYGHTVWVSKEANHSSS
ncbi:unnamed protein product [Urochloa decumbens]|uniref:BURP domain-containing protein n=1 Tax=Urochloa decumbens TaxID=240449 RepID=A0ABC8WBW0_9POAL